MPSNTNTCPCCGGQLVEIDHYGDRLIGCAKCNKWNWRGGKGLEVELPQDDLEALRAFMGWSASASDQPR
jgi:hypothetical protein